MYSSWVAFRGAMYVAGAGAGADGSIAAQHELEVRVELSETIDGQALGRPRAPASPAAVSVVARSESSRPVRRG